MEDYYVGTIEIFAFAFAPVGWLLCNGALLQVSQYATLYNLIKGTYGGDGITNYKLPNLLGTEPFPYMKYYIAAEGLSPVSQG
jgi:microcystin-dependent protein